MSSNSSSSTPSPSIPSRAQIVIVGGGIIGCSVAYHLAKAGYRDVLLLEQSKLSGGTTWHAAGMVGRLRASRGLTQMNDYSARLYSQLAEETGVDPDWTQVGSLYVAQSQERMTQLRRTLATARGFGIEGDMIGVDEIKRLWPLIRSADLVGGAFLPTDGKVNPGQTALALAAGARQYGATLLEGVQVTGIRHLNLRHQSGHHHNGHQQSGHQQSRRATGVVTAQGATIEAEVVVLCGGMWTRQLALTCHVNIPLYPVQHHYAVTEPLADVHHHLPNLRDPDAMTYFRTDGNALWLGAFQEESKPWDVTPIPPDFSFDLLEPDWDGFAIPLRAGQWRVPRLAQSKFAKFVNGPESFTPDNNFILGETPEMAGLFVLAGMNSVGIASAGGAGQALAQWIMEGEPTTDLWSVDVRRFAPFQNGRRYLRQRVGEVLGVHYQMAWPNREMMSARNIRRTPIHDKLAASGACFGQKLGWERPNWFAPTGVTPETVYAFGRQNWFAHVGAEHAAARSNVALFEQSSFAKYWVSGPHARPFLQRLCANNVDVPVGRAVYTAMLNRRGGFESDLTVTRRAEDAFYLVSGSAQSTRDMAWMRQQLALSTSLPLHDERISDVQISDVHISDVTHTTGVLSIMGPHARALLQQISDADLSNQAFPFGTAQVIDVGLGTALAIRITYVGELGWELHIPMDQMATVYDALVAAGEPFGLKHAGHYAINSLRLEKGYLAWGTDLSPDETPLEAGLSFAVDWHKPFVGREALQKQEQAGMQKRMAFFVLRDPAPVLWGNEPILRRDQNGDANVVGYLTSGAYAYTLGGAIGAGYVRSRQAANAAYVRGGEYAIDVAGTPYAATIYLRSPYDPTRSHILA